jgi:exopolysaccharide biosynthesis polyprenyl glycosylphosphotransferase
VLAGAPLRPALRRACLSAVASAARINVLAGGSDLPLARDIDTAAPPSEDPLEAIDDRTRRLLERRPGSRRTKIVPRALVVADLLGMTLSYLSATLLSARDGGLHSNRELLLFALSLPCWILVAGLHGLYHRDEERVGHSTTDDVVSVFHLVTIGVWLLLVASRLAGWNKPGALSLAAFWLLAVVLVPLARSLARAACRHSQGYQQNTIIVGAGDIGQLICRKLIKHPEYGVNVVGFVDRAPKARRLDLPERLSILGGPERLPEIIERLQVERVVISFSNASVPELLEQLRRLQPLGVQIDLVPRLFELIGPRVSVHAVEGLTLVGVPPSRRSTGARLVKRTIDVTGATVGLILLSPLMAYIALRIRRDSPGPVLFRQTRLGAGMRPFTVLKFRTMRMGTDSAAHRAYIARTMSIAAETNGNGLYKLDREDSVTKVGRWLRKSSLDELPQLINVLRGEMSLVGPRPCIPYELENFQPHHFDRFLMPQGVTGLWQVTARANSTYYEALDLDVAYVHDWSLGLDLRLLLRTPFQVMRHRSSTA